LYERQEEPQNAMDVFVRSFVGPAFYELTEAEKALKKGNKELVTIL
jgi:hypothetical protein